MDSQDLQGVIIGISTALSLGRFEDAPMENLLKKAQELVAAGQLSEDVLQKVNATMVMFFWIGWHARGAAEDSDDMLRMME